jgi:uncharacterized protein with HEPN domain
MSLKAERVPDYLGHILQAIERIHEYIADMDEPGFLQDRKTQDAVVRNFEIIGEATSRIKRVAPDFIAQHNDIPWLFMVDMRNNVSHGYDKVDLERVWKTVQNDLPPLHQQVTQVKAQAERAKAGDAPKRTA